LRKLITIVVLVKEKSALRLKKNKEKDKWMGMKFEGERKLIVEKSVNKEC
jgi:hypothetical protein